MVIIGAVSLSCSKEDTTNNPYMSFDEIVYVDSSANEIQLQDPEIIDLPAYGIASFKIIDSLMVTANYGDHNMISVFLGPDFKELCSFFDKGNGPMELRETPSFYGIRIVRDDNQVNLYIPDRRNNVIKFNLTESLLNHQLSASYQNRDIPDCMFLSLYIDDTTMFCKNIAGYYDRQERFIYTNDTLIIPESMEILNETTVPVQNDGFLFNAIGAAYGYCRQKDIVAEATFYMNHINMYGLRNDFRKTIYLEKKRISVNDVCRGGWRGMKEKTVCLRYYDNMFAILSCDRKNSIIAFDWDGNYLFTLLIPDKHVSSFDFDLKGHAVYTYDIASETMKKYDCLAI